MPTFIGLNVRQFGLDYPLNVEVVYKLADVNYTMHAMDHFRCRYPTSHFVVCSDDLNGAERTVAVLIFIFHPNV